MKLVAIFSAQPPGVWELINDLGDGENGFAGTPIGSGNMTLAEYIARSHDLTDPSKLKAGRVPQTAYWLLDDAGMVVGMVKVRHHLNERLRVYGGHVGYFVRRDLRGRGYGTAALRLALAELRRLGQMRVLITVHFDNTPSIKVVEANGGRLEDVIVDPQTGATVKRFWIDLPPGKAAIELKLSDTGEILEEEHT